MTLVASLKEHLFQAVAAAAAIGGGTAIVNGAITNARQDEQLRVASTVLPQIQQDVKATREAVIRLEARQTDNEPRK